jgi:hypothetical protein
VVRTGAPAAPAEATAALSDVRARRGAPEGGVEVPHAGSDGPRPRTSLCILHKALLLLTVQRARARTRLTHDLPLPAPSLLRLRLGRPSLLRLLNTEEFARGAVTCVDYIFLREGGGGR